jgi:hypothetical protein
MTMTISIQNYRIVLWTKKDTDSPKLPIETENESLFWKIKNSMSTQSITISF